MAKRKKTKKVHHKRRSKVGAIGKDGIMDMAIIVGGAVVAKVLSNKLATSTNATLLKFGAYVPLALGVVLPMVVKNPMLAKISIGLIAGGGITALGSGGLKVISGFESSIGYPGRPNYDRARALVNGIGSPAGNQGLLKGTHSNFSGSRQSQIATIGAINSVCNSN